MTPPARRLLIAVIGNGDVAPDSFAAEQARAVGRCLVDGGARVVTGGRRGVMEAALQGARSSDRYREGDTVAIYPGFDPAGATPFADIVIATGLDVARNILVANSDGVVIVGGASGTLMEIASAWHARRPIVALPVDGWGLKLAGTRLDTRVRQPADVVAVEDDIIHAADSPEHAAALILEMAPRYTSRHDSIR
jgi:uncharacterized protein (TIGR00725 family)